MPQNMDINTPDARQTALAAKFTSVTLKQPRGEIRSIDLNQEVDLNSDNDNEAEPQEQVTPPTQSSPKKTSGDKPKTEEASESDGSSTDDGEGTGGDDTNPKSGDVRFEELDETGSQEPEPEKKPAVEVVQDGEIPHGPRDYAAFPDQALVPILKALNNTQFKKSEPVLRALVERAREADALKEQIKARPEKPVYQYENPESYRLSPEYNALESDISIGDFELNHWEQQAIRVANGEAWQNITPDKDGKYTYTKIPAPEDGRIDQNALLAIQNHLGSLRPEVIRLKHQAQDYRSHYQAQAKESDNALEEIVQRVFPTLKDLSKLTPAEQNLVKQAKQIIPPVFQDHPLIGKVFTRMTVFVERQKNKILSLAAENKKLKAQLEDKEVAEPTVIPNGAGKSTSGGSGKAFKYKDGRKISADEVVQFDDE